MENTTKPKVAIISPTGLVGSAIYDLFKDKYELGLVFRNKDRLNLLFERFEEAENLTMFQIEFADLYKEQLASFHGEKYGEKLGELIEFLRDYDFIVNASCIINPFCDDVPDLAFYVNSVLPHILAEEFGNRFIHVTTDCVFNSIEDAPYDETSQKLPSDLYGVTKMLGEPMKAITLRFSTIGYELSGSRGLLEWLISQKGKEINGFTNHLWNGITSSELAKAIKKIIDKEVLVDSGIYHIFSDDITKHDLLIQLNEALELGCAINAVEADTSADRRLRTNKGLNEKLQIPSLKQMIKELCLVKTT
ncbi:MAG: sugar nucleotide-binding protein [Patescibacteria group bacterium]|nr:sugar nucleotide-binding protein [Patescibacteria group bacterium]